MLEFGTTKDLPLAEIVIAFVDVFLKVIVCPKLIVDGKFIVPLAGFCITNTNLSFIVSALIVYGDVDIGFIICPIFPFTIRVVVVNTPLFSEMS